MSEESVQRIVDRAVTDEDFRKALKTDPDSVLSDLDITTEERQALKSLDWDSIGSDSIELDQRISRILLAR
jgi:hypothetical protein